MVGAAKKGLQKNTPFRGIIKKKPLKMITKKATLGSCQYPIHLSLV